jgi:hypothetical protein
MKDSLKLSDYGIVISDKELGETILKKILKLLDEHPTVIVDFEDVKSMATFCSKQIFGRLYLNLTPQNFYERLSFKNVNDDVKLLLKIGIQDAIEEMENKN